MNDDGNIADTLRRQAAAHPEALAVAWPQGTRRGVPRYGRMSFGHLDAASEDLARRLVSAGLGDGQRVGLLVPPGRQFFILVFALLKAGSVMVCIDPGIGLRRFGRCLAVASVAAVIGSPKTLLARWIGRWVPGVSRYVVDGSFPGARRLDRLDPTAATRLPTMGPTDPAAVLFTSGSTGPPKGVCYTHGNFIAQLEALQQAFAIEPGEVDCATFPLFALFAPGLGMSAVVPRMNFTRPARVHPPMLQHCIETFGVTSLFGSPALLDTVVRWAARHPTHWRGVRRVTSAGAPVPPRVIAGMHTILDPGVEVFTPYGATECLPVAVIGSQTILGETAAATAKGAGTCVGHPVPSVEVRILPISDAVLTDIDEVTPLPTGAIGEICVRAPQATAVYFNSPEATAQAKIPAGEDGFFHRMGDVGYRDEEGRLWFCGRKAHRVVGPEATWFSIPCEGVFNDHPQVRRSALLRLGPQGAARPALCVELEPGVRWRPSLEAELRQRAQVHPHTSAIDVFLPHASFPVDIRHNAKIDRLALSAWAMRRLGITE